MLHTYIHIIFITIKYMYIRKYEYLAVIGINSGLNVTMACYKSVSMSYFQNQCAK